ncbi:hypothetical protein [Pseudonocardia alni]|uniref:hypothetical protein n=1 Tax=Pseudonocardia alni TaxID=33907 RepID=UPI00280BAF55|nr:hypothetical protein [Pseudonocardia alni]
MSEDWERSGAVGECRSWGVRDEVSRELGDMILATSKKSSWLAIRSAPMRGAWRATRRTAGAAADAMVHIAAVGIST